MDDKAKVPIGEPGTPESSTSHDKRVLMKNTSIQSSSDHNYHFASLTPSVHLICDIPDVATKSFYTGQIYVGIKDSIFEGSNPIRHIVEMISVLRNEWNDFPWYMCMFSDGGGDHNVTFIYVQCVLLAFFRICNFDVLNVGRCAPHQSYINPAERAMSLLNIGLQGLALERNYAGKFEKILTACKSMK